MARICRESSSLSTRAGYFALKTLLIVALSCVSSGHPNRSLVKSVTSVKSWLPRLDASASLYIQYHWIRVSSKKGQ